MRPTRESIHPERAMRDQAFQLRNLAFQAARRRQAEEGPAPRLLALSGGKGGVGVTTLAVNLSVAMGIQGSRVVLVDADLYRADVATLCGLSDRGNVSDVLDGRCDIHEVLERGPGGILVVPGLWAPDVMTDCSDVAQQRLIRQFMTLGRHADLVVVDVGGGSGKVVRGFFEAADEIVLVTTPDPVAVMDTYATIKTLLAGPHRAPVRIVVNQANGQSDAENVYRRIERSCRRFLAKDVELLGWLPADGSIGAATRRSPSSGVGTFQSPVLRAVARIATKLIRQSESASLTEKRAAA